MFASSRRSCLRRHTREQGRSPEETARAQRLASRSRSRSLPGRRGSPLRLQGPVLGQPDQQQENRERQGGPARRPGPRSLPDSEEAWCVARETPWQAKGTSRHSREGYRGSGGAPLHPELGTAGGCLLGVIGVLGGGVRSRLGRPRLPLCPCLCCVSVPTHFHVYVSVLKSMQKSVSTSTSIQTDLWIKV